MITTTITTTTTTTTNTTTTTTNNNNNINNNNNNSAHSPSYSFPFPSNHSPSRDRPTSFHLAGGGEQENLKKRQTPWLVDKENFAPHSSLKALKQLLFNLKTLLRYLIYTKNNKKHHNICF